MTSSPHQQGLSIQRDAMRAELSLALEDDDDPLAAYDNFVKWTLQNYANHSDSGLLELLEETARIFKDDLRYMAGDLRYLKLWILFANHVKKPTAVYAYMWEKGIGKLYALFFKEYAESLEREARYVLVSYRDNAVTLAARLAEAETVITLGIRTRAKPLKRLQSFQNDFNARRAAGMPLSAKAPPFRKVCCQYH